MNGALAQLIPDRVPPPGRAAARSRSSPGPVEQRAVRLQRARRRHLGRPPGRRRERRAREPLRQHGEHPGRAGRERLADHDRALRPRHRLRRSGPVPRRARGRAGLARPRARHGRPRPLRPAGPSPLRPRGRAGRRSVVEPALPRRTGRSSGCRRCSSRRSSSPATSSITGCPAAAAGGVRSSGSPRRSPRTCSTRRSPSPRPASSTASSIAADGSVDTAATDGAAAREGGPVTAPGSALFASAGGDRVGHRARPGAGLPDARRARAGVHRPRRRRRQPRAPPRGLDRRCR